MGARNGLNVTDLPNFVDTILKIIRNQIKYITCVKFKNSSLHTIVTVELVLYKNTSMTWHLHLNYLNKLYNILNKICTYKTLTIDKNKTNYCLVLNNHRLDVSYYIYSKLTKIKIKEEKKNKKRTTIRLLRNKLFWEPIKACRTNPVENKIDIDDVIIVFYKKKGCFCIWSYTSTCFRIHFLN